MRRLWERQWKAAQPPLGRFEAARARPVRRNRPAQQASQARHVHYGVLALREHMTKVLSESERREREDWAFEVALLMRNRFMAYEVFEEWFEGRMPRAKWRELVTQAPGMNIFRQVMFSRLVPNLREIGLMSPRILPKYEAAGLMQYFAGAAADRLSGEQMIRDLDAEVDVGTGPQLGKPPTTSGARRPSCRCQRPDGSPTGSATSPSRRAPTHQPASEAPWWRSCTRRGATASGCA